MNDHELLNAENELEAVRDAYLRKNGWDCSSSNPACIWLWHKELPDGRVVMLSAEAAVQFQRMWIE